MTFQHILKQDAEYRIWHGSAHRWWYSPSKNGHEVNASGQRLISSFCRNSIWIDQIESDTKSHNDCMNSSLNDWTRERAQVSQVFTFLPVSIKTIIHTVALLVCSARPAVSRVRKRRHLFGQRARLSLHRNCRRARLRDWHVDFEKPDVRTLMKARMYKVESSFTS